jgi:integrase
MNEIPGDHVQTICGALGTVGLSAPGKLGNTTLVSLCADHSSSPRRHARSVAAVPARVASFIPTTRLLREAAAAFLAQPDLAASTRRSYRQTLGRLERELGADRLLATLTADQVTGAVTAAWAGRAPATWNRHVATVRSFFGFCRRRRWLVDDLTVDLERRPEPADRTKAIPLAALERLWRRDDVGVREKALWRLLYETAARASEALSINVEDLELDNKRVRVRSKGGDLDWLHFQTGSARLLPRLLGRRTRGPLFLTDRAPVPARAPAVGDRCADTGRARLSYRRAGALFCEASGGWTLHQLRHSALTHLAEQNVSLPLLMAKSRHTSLRSLQRYARPGPEAVAALTAATDPARRR